MLDQEQNLVDCQKSKGNMVARMRNDECPALHTSHEESLWAACNREDWGAVEKICDEMQKFRRQRERKVAQVLRSVVMTSSAVDADRYHAIEALIREAGSAIPCNENVYYQVPLHSIQREPFWSLVLGAARHEIAFNSNQSFAGEDDADYIYEEGCFRRSLVEVEALPNRNPSWGDEAVLTPTLTSEDEQSLREMGTIINKPDQHNSLQTELSGRTDSFGRNLLHLALRHETLTSLTMHLLLYCDRHARYPMILARDNAGYRPVHLACRELRSIDVLDVLLNTMVEKFPKQIEHSISRPHPLCGFIADDGLNELDMIWMGQFRLSEQGGHHPFDMMLDLGTMALCTAIKQVQHGRPGCQESDMSCFWKHWRLLAQFGCGEEDESQHFVNKFARLASHAPTPMTELLFRFVVAHEGNLDVRDRQGRLPLHYAAMSQNSLHSHKYCLRSRKAQRGLVKFICDEYPHACRVPDCTGKLPLHTLLEHAGCVHTRYKTSICPLDGIVLDLVNHCPSSVEASVDGLYPFQLVACNNSFALDTVFSVLRKSPGALFAAIHPK